jgi:hypothetical protein
VKQALPARALTSRAAAASKPAVKVTTPVMAVRALPSAAPVMLEVTSVTPPAPATPNTASPHAVEIVSTLAPPAPEPGAMVPAKEAENAIGIGMDPSQVLGELLADRQQALVRGLHKLGVQRGQLLFDGRWMSAADARVLFRGMQMRSWLTVVEAILLIGAMVASTGVIGVLLAILVGLRPG